MSQPFVGEIRIFAGSFAPAGWMFCEGQLLPIDEYETLFVLIGTTYGGDGQSTFALPDMRGRIPLHQGQGPGLSNYQLAQALGVEEVTLTVSQTPAHSHPFVAYDKVANSPNAGNNLLALSSQANMFFGDPPNVPMNAGMISAAGGSQPHENVMPFLCVNYIISMFGVFPHQ